MKHIILIFLGINFLMACTTASSRKEKELPGKEQALLRRENEVLKKENTALNQPRPVSDEAATSGDTVSRAADAAPVGLNWMGTWTFEDNGPVTYTLRIDDTYRGMNLCTYSASGVQTHYTLECRGLGKNNTFELYYRSTTDGVFFMGDKIDANKPALTLTYKNGKVLTYWNQFINNYVEQGNRSGEVCFQKK